MPPGSRASARAWPPSPRGGARWSPRRRRQPTRSRGPAAPSRPRAGGTRAGSAQRPSRRAPGLPPCTGPERAAARTSAGPAHRKRSSAFCVVVKWWPLNASIASKCAADKRPQLLLSAATGCCWRSSVSSSRIQSAAGHLFSAFALTTAAQALGSSGRASICSASASAGADSVVSKRGATGGSPGAWNHACQSTCASAARRSTVSPHRGLEVVRERIAEHARLDLALEPQRPALVEPHVAPRAVRHEVPGPRVRDLVGHGVRERPVARQQRRRHEHKARVRHAAVRERRREAHEVAPRPHVRLGRDGLCVRQERLGLRELVRRPGHDGRLGPDAAARPELRALEPPGRDRQQVRRDRHVLAERHHALARRHRDRSLALVLAGFVHDRAHQHRAPLGRGDHGRVRELGGGRVGCRHDAARVDRLALREEERVRPAGRELLREPVQRARCRVVGR
ncbi:hypothetical protein PybrP1_013030 [[Pythium] brassicae (nom. inval.)]|nr:hypothetical protein PybrP1_013030 [[Pythium] brassicae (nom. inval.)]